jgi:hypothetical protein
MSIFAQLASPVWKQLEGYGLIRQRYSGKRELRLKWFHEPGAGYPKALDRLYELASEMSRDAFFGLRQQQYFLPGAGCAGIHLAGQQHDPHGLPAHEPLRTHDQ